MAKSGVVIAQVGILELKAFPKDEYFTALIDAFVENSLPTLLESAEADESVISAISRYRSVTGLSLNALGHEHLKKVFREKMVLGAGVEKNAFILQILQQR